MESRSIKQNPEIVFASWSTCDAKKTQLVIRSFLRQSDGVFLAHQLCLNNIIALFPLSADSFTSPELSTLRPPELLRTKCMRVQLDFGIVYLILFPSEIPSIYPSGQDQIFVLFLTWKLKMLRKMEISVIRSR